jgi:hypothetical protein
MLRALWNRNAEFVGLILVPSEALLQLLPSRITKLKKVSIDR